MDIITGLSCLNNRISLVLGSSFEVRKLSGEGCLPSLASLELVHNAYLVVKKYKRQNKKCVQFRNVYIFEV